MTVSNKALYIGNTQVDTGEDFLHLSYKGGRLFYLKRDGHGKRSVKWGEKTLYVLKRDERPIMPIDVIADKLLAVEMMRDNKKAVLFGKERSQEWDDVDHVSEDDDAPLYAAKDENGWRVMWGKVAQSNLFTDIAGVICTSSSPAYIARQKDEDRWAAWCGKDEKSKDYDQILSLTHNDRVISFGARHGRRLFHVSYQMP